MGSIGQIIRTLVRDGYPSIGSVAEIAGCSIRTLQRRLAGADLNYSHLVKRARFQLAREFLVNSDNRVIDVAFELGYSDLPSFSRAFSRWAGLSPRAFQRQFMN